MLFLLFFFNDTATTEIYTLSLHALFRSGGELEGLILAQDERWRRALCMQVERSDSPQGLSGSGERLSNA